MPRGPLNRFAATGLCVLPFVGLACERQYEVGGSLGWSVAAAACWILEIALLVEVSRF